MEKVFTKFLEDQNLVNQRLLLMVSGGVDSMVLLDVARKVIDKKNILVFHLDHNFRDSSSDDAIFVQNICSKMSIEFQTEKLGENTLSNQENNGRKARKKYSQIAAEKFGAVRILTAHHATDLVETMIFRLTKGCGVDGLSPFDTTTKPFWQIPKSELIKYAKAQRIEWHEDLSNNDVSFERNLIRKEVLPVLRKITPNLEKVFVRESQIFSETQKFITKSMDTNHQQIALETFHDLPKTLQQEWLRKIAKKTPSASEIEDALRWLNNHPEGNSHKAVGGTELFINHGKIEC